MPVFRVIKPVQFIFNNCGFTTLGYVRNSRTLFSVVVQLPPVLNRGVHSQPINKDMQYYSNDRITFKADNKTFKLNQHVDRPLCVMMSWMLAKPRHLKKYTSIYLDMGYDVLAVSCTPLQLMWPERGSQVIAANLLKFLETNEDYNPIIVHGFSVGAYVWAELLVHSLNNMERFKPVLDRVGAQVWDSPADVEEIPVGMPLAMFPKNKLLQKLLTAYTEAHMRIFHNVATRHYLRATQAYRHTPCRAPTLFLVSRVDPVGTEQRSRRAYEVMTNSGMKCHLKCWESSPHVQHYSRHPQEYLGELRAHLTECGLLPSREAAAVAV